MRFSIWRPIPEFAAIPDRWRIVSALGYLERKWDPYNGNNVLKGDRPAFGKDWFFSMGLISDSTFEGRSVPTPVATATPPSKGSIDLAGEPAQSAGCQEPGWDGWLRVGGHRVRKRIEGACSCTASGGCV